MEIKDKEQAIKRYEERLIKFGRSVLTMGWRDEVQQALRFKILSQIGELRDKKILDVGCGFGDLFKYLLAQNIEVEYTGYDISSKIIAVAQKELPGVRFVIKDILDASTGEKFDYVFSSGVFNHQVSNNLEFTKVMIKRMFELSNCGIAVNMMTDYVDYKDEYLFYYSPEEMFRFAKSLTRYVVLRHDYPLYEFTLYLYHDLDSQGVG